MTIKGKLAALMAIVAISSFLFVMRAVKEKVAFDNNIEMIHHKLSHINTMSLLRHHVLMKTESAYIIMLSGKSKDSDKFNRDSKKMKDLAEQWRREESLLGHHSHEDKASGIIMMNELFTSALMMEINSVSRVGDEGERLNSPSPLPLSKEIVMDMDKHIHMELKSLEQEYGEVLFLMGGTHSLGEDVIKQVEIARNALTYLNVSNRALTGIHLHLLEFMNQIHEGNIDSLPLLSIEASTKMYMKEWARTLDYHDELGVDGEEEDMEVAASVRGIYEELQGIMAAHGGLAIQSGPEREGLINEIDKKMDKLSEFLDIVMDDAVMETREAHAELIYMMRRAWLYSMVLTAFLVLSVIFLSIVTARGIVKGINSLSSGAKAVGENLLEHRICCNTKDEFGLLAKAFNDMAEELVQTTVSRDYLSLEVEERKRISGELIKAKIKAEESNRLKSEFLNTMSHELRTPITIMLGNTPLLTEADELPDKEEIAEIAMDIEEAGKHLLVLINDILDLSKIEAGRFNLSNAVLSSGDIVNAIATAAEGLARFREKGLLLEVKKDDFEFVADPIRLKQILLNLVSNAVKFTDSGKVAIKARQTLEGAVFEVSDTGMGIENDKLDIIFEPFQQADGSSTRRSGGTGLGLAITKKLVELHGGEIRVESNPGKGSTFSILIPVLKEV